MADHSNADKTALENSEDATHQFAGPSAAEDENVAQTRQQKPTEKVGPRQQHEPPTPDSEKVHMASSSSGRKLLLPNGSPAARRSSSDQASQALPLARSRTTHGVHGGAERPREKVGENGVASKPSETGTAAVFANGDRKRRSRGHLRGTRSNGFASGPPFPKSACLSDGSGDEGGGLKRRPSIDSWMATLKERQKQQQMALIEQELDVMAKETQCGIGKWRPQWLQRCGNRFWMIVWLCWFCTVQGMIVNGLFPSSISTIERRFHLSTTTLGRIMQFYDFGYVIFCIPVSYFGGRHSKPLCISAGLLMMALGSLLFTMPHFISESYTSSFSGSTGLSQCFHSGRRNETESFLLNASTETETKTGLDSLPLALALSSGASSSSVEETATLDGVSAQCPSPENQPGTFRYVFIFCLAHFLHGVGATPLFTIGVSYIDENVGPAISSLFIGVFYAFAIFGPAIGFFASSKFLLWHTDWMNTGQKLQKLIIDLEETDPKWVGAWYMGFLLASFLGLLAVFPILVLPKVLPESLKWHRTRLREALEPKRSPECCGVPASSSNRAAMFGGIDEEHNRKKSLRLHQQQHQGNIDETDKSTADCGEPLPLPPVQIPRSPGITRSGPLLYQLWLDVRHIPIAIARILLNGPYMLITLGMAIDGLIVTGCSTFMSKYLERQFGVAPSKANLFIGAIMVPMAGFGTIFSGIIIHKYRMSCVRTLQYCIALVLASLFLSPMYFIYCDHDKLVGIERHYPVNDDMASHYDPDSQTYQYRLETTCNGRCQCNPGEYHPICAELTDGSQMAFYSPCYAGCQQPYSPSTKNYFNCSCVPEGTKGGFRRARKGFCESKCRGLFAFMILFAPFCFFTFAVGVALITVVLRTVDHEERSFALGIQWILVRVIGTIPAPMVFSWLFDFSCVRRYLDPCSLTEDGGCMLYHNKSLADLFLAFSVAGQLVALVCLISVLMFFVASLRDEPLPAQGADAPLNLPALEALTEGGHQPPTKKLGLLLLGSPRSSASAAQLPTSGGGGLAKPSELEPMLLQQLQPPPPGKKQPPFVAGHQHSTSAEEQPLRNLIYVTGTANEERFGTTRDEVGEQSPGGGGIGGRSIGRYSAGGLRFLSDVV